MPEQTPIKALLLDIEGTTTPVEFVYDVLFPYARARVEEFVRRLGHTEDVGDDIEGLRRQHAADVEEDLNPPPWKLGPGDLEAAPAGGEAPGVVADNVESLVAYVHWMMEEDRKSTPLKSLQGKIWEDGYRSGALEGQVYPDVRGAFKRWRQQGRQIFIYSSGSVLAQKLLFGNSTAGNLGELISGYFDTTTGPKKEEASYRKIATEVGVPPEQIWFTSDVADELDAARRAGMQTALCVRSQGPPPEASGHPVIRSFEGVFS